MFHSNKYTKWYYYIIYRAKSQDRKRLSKNDPFYIYLEKHHIVPKSFGGLDKEDNLVLVSAKEHFILHALLTKMCISTRHTQQMLNAMNRLRQSNKYQERYFSSRLYDLMKRNIVCSEEKKDKHRNRVTCKNILTGEYLQIPKDVFDISPNLVGINYGKKQSTKWKENHSKFMEENNPFYGKTHNEETKRKIGKKNRENMLNRIWITNGQYTMRILPSESIPDGFRLGRK